MHGFHCLKGNALPSTETIRSFTVCTPSSPETPTLSFPTDGGEILLVML